MQQTLTVEEAPAVRTLRALQERALAVSASDLHFEPTASGGRVRFRVDGMLRDFETLDAGLYLPLISRVKLLAGMDIADRRQPQDGRYTIASVKGSVDARVSSIPTIDGEKVVIRLLDIHAKNPSLDNLGMRASTLARYRRMIASPYGFLIVTGPTGSGKTTTLYSSLREIANRMRSVCTVEDPVEMRLDGIAQVNVNMRAGLDFSNVLRSFLRQDPNVIMVGEMRDIATASIAISAALSGQLVLTTLHSNDAPRSIDRLVELGVDRHAIGAAVFGILSQRLVRRLCHECRTFDSSSRSYTASGCGACARSGYCGRVGLFELLEVDDEMREAVTTGASVVAIRRLAARSGYEPLATDGAAKVASGETSNDELRRVLGAVA
ncbi:MAG TPA: GspE/PulE family protein [Candidatus Baltobacteraceae bacterium]|jgi:type II secretory ATPase GspE/PulE/Tfp pilus assembly ATPase PilB-like protein